MKNRPWILLGISGERSGENKVKYFDKILRHLPPKKLSWFCIVTCWIWFWSKYSTLCLNPLGVLLMALSAAAVDNDLVGVVFLVCSPDLLGPCPRFTQSHRETHGHVPTQWWINASRVTSHPITADCRCPLEFFLLSSLRYTHILILTPSGSNLYSTF